MEPLYHEEYLEFEINWMRPRRYEDVRDEGSDYDEQSNLYLISARYGDRNPKALYIGKTWAQTVSARLRQNDHHGRYAAFVKNYPHHKFYVSHGIVSVNEGRLTEKKLDALERILIYTSEPEHAHNIQNFYEHGVSGSIEINNRGSRSTLPSVIKLGVFVKY